jgi:hypothetical protein
MHRLTIHLLPTLVQRTSTMLSRQISLTSVVARVAIVLFLLLTSTPALSQPEDDFDLDWNTIDCGGGETEVVIEEETWSLDGTIGQFDAGFSSTPPPEGGNGQPEFTLEGGFWPGMLPNTCTHDLNANGNVDVNDMVMIIMSWGECPQPCPPGCVGDIAPAPSGDCAVNADDLLAVITNWGPCS